MEMVVVMWQIARVVRIALADAQICVYLRTFSSARWDFLKMRRGERQLALDASMLPLEIFLFTMDARMSNLKYGNQRNALQRMYVRCSDVKLVAVSSHTLQRFLWFYAFADGAATSAAYVLCRAGEESYLAIGTMSSSNVLTGGRCA